MTPWWATTCLVRQCSGPLLLPFKCFLPRHGIRQIGCSCDVGTDKDGHRAVIFYHFYGRAIRIMRAEGRPGLLCSWTHTQAARTRDALMEYLFLTLFIASSGAESEISKAADRWDRPHMVLRLSDLSLCFLSCPSPHPALHFISLPELLGVLWLSYISQGLLLPSN